VKALNIARKTIIEAIRDPQLLILFLIFPAMMVYLYFIAYGGGAKNLGSTLILLVDNRDRGSLGNDLVARLRSEKFEGAPLFTVTEINDPREARTILNEWKASALLTIPQDFTARLQAADPSLPPRLEMLKDPYSDTANFLSTMFEEPMREFITEKTGWAQPQQEVVYEFVEGTGNLNDFQFGIPGVIVFGVCFGILYTAILLVREMVSDAFKRLRLAGVTGWDLIGGITLAQLAVCAAQVAITLAAAYACGLQTSGSVLLLGLFALITCLTAAGCGMITACFSKSDGEAANFAMIFLVPLVFFSGAMYPLPPMPLFTLFGKTVDFAELMPTTFATDAIRRIMIYGDGLTAVWPDLLWLVIDSLILFVLGVALFQRFRLNRAS